MMVIIDTMMRLMIDVVNYDNNFRSDHKHEPTIPLSVIIKTDVRNKHNFILNKLTANFGTILSLFNKHLYCISFYIYFMNTEEYFAVHKRPSY